MKAKTLVLLLLLLFALCGTAAAARLDTSLEFSTIETPHFSIHFHQGLDRVAKRAATIAEDVHVELSRGLKWTPREKTHLVLIDDSDFANGFATVLPYNLIYAMVAPPSVNSTIGEYDDWLKILITHEYAHILTMDASRGYSLVMRTVFGKPVPGPNPFSALLFLVSAPPNVFLPRWWHEGTATWAETEFTGSGRGVASYYGMILRSAAASGDLPSIDRINGDVPYWPGGHMPYIYGMALSRHISKKYGPEAPGELSYVHSGRFPYFLNGAPRRLFGDENYVTLYRKMLAELKTTEAGKIAVLKGAPLTAFETVADDGELLTNPRHSPDGRLLAYNRRDPHEHESVVITSAQDKARVAEFRRRFSDRTIAWAPDSSKIYFAQAEVVRGFNIYQDLYSYDLKARRVRRLTRGKRIMEPDISPDGGRAVVVTGSGGGQDLAILDLERLGEKGYGPEALTSFELTRVTGPRWSPDGTMVAFCTTDARGVSALNLYDVGSGAVKELTSGPHTVSSPGWSPDGSFILYVSEETGVYNIYAYSMAEARSYQVSHVLGGAFEPDVAPDGSSIAFSSYSSRGFEIARTAYDPKAWSPERGPSIEYAWPGPPGGGAQGADHEAGAGQGEATRYAKKGYSALPSLMPRFWLPTLYADHDGTVAGAFTAGQDALGYHTYLAELGYGSASNELYYDLVYLNDQMYPTLVVEAASRPVLYSDFFERGDYWERHRTMLLAASIPINRLESLHRVIFGYRLLRQDGLTDVAGSFNGIDVFEGRRDNLFLSFVFTNALKYGYSISREEGQTLRLTYRYYSKEVYSDVHAKEYLADYSRYFALPFEGRLRHSVVYLNLKGGASSGEKINQQSFQLGGDPNESDFVLRGYPSRFELGKYVATATLELRAPLWYMLRGRNTKPFFWDRLHGALFTDVGETWGEGQSLTSDRLKVGVGLEARLDLTLGYFFKITPAIGVARGLRSGGETRAYFTIYAFL